MKLRNTPTLLLSLLALNGLQATAAKVEAPPPVTHVAITTEPVDAEVFVDRKLRGSSPVALTDLTPGKHLITVSETGYNTAYRTINVIEGARLAVDITLDRLLGLVFVQSAPTGADIVIDGAHRGRTPQLVTDLPLGDYRIELSAPGYQPATVPLYIRDRTPQGITTKLRLDAAALTIESDPPGASVSVNGIDQGQAPCRVDRVPEGTATIDVTADGYHPYQQKLRLTAGDDQSLMARLRPIPGALRIVSQPVGARIYVDNQFRGVAPVALADLKPGTYRVRAELDAHDATARSVTVTRAANLIEEFRMTPNCGTVILTTEPAGATAFIDDKQAGTSMAKVDQTDRVSEPLTIKLVKVGPHELRVTAKGYFDRTIPLTIERNKTVTLHAKLKRRFIPDFEVKTASKTYTGVLIRIGTEFILLESAPGVTTRIPLNEVLSRRVLVGTAIESVTPAPR